MTSDLIPNTETNDTTLIVAAVQMRSSRLLEQNLTAADALIAEAARRGAQVAVLPENFATFGRARLADMCFVGADPISEFLSDAARRHRLWLVGGSQPLCATDDGEPAPPGKVFPSSCVYNPQGERTVRYDKCHLFDASVADGVGQYRESDLFARGAGPVCASVGGMDWGLSICYDLRFANYFEALRALGAEVVAVPSAFTHTTGAAHWEVLLRARAIEQQLYLVAANQSGEHDSGRSTWGHSMIVDPWGRVLDECEEEGEGLAVATLSRQLIGEIRQQMPVWNHRRRFDTAFAAD